MVLCDPPYSSGGLYAGDRKKSTREKYTCRSFKGAASFADFSGDNMDQRSFTEFMRMVLAKARYKTVPGGIAAVFVDWRNLAAMTDALQAAGWVYRGIIAWDKGNSRATPNRFRNDCEYIVWGTNGKREVKYKPGVFVGAGCYHIPGMNARKKHHQTEKPVELLEKLVGIVSAGGTVLDCFMGSGSTGGSLCENRKAVYRHRIRWRVFQNGEGKDCCCRRRSFGLYRLEERERRTI